MENSNSEREIRAAIPECQTEQRGAAQERPTKRGAHAYLVIAGSEYEYGCNLRVFDTKQDAEAFQAICIAYQATRPALEGCDDNSDAGYAKFDRSYRRLQRWIKRHPGEDYSNFDIEKLPRGAPLT